MFDLQFAGMGLFDFKGEWIHPTKTKTTYELIYVVNSEVNNAY